MANITTFGIVFLVRILFWQIFAFSQQNREQRERGEESIQTVTGAAEPPFKRAVALFFLIYKNGSIAFFLSSIEGGADFFESLDVQIVFRPFKGGWGGVWHALQR